MFIAKYSMPGRLNGADMARLVANVYPELKIVLSSAYRASTELPPLKQMTFLSKPWRLEQLLDICHQVMKQHRQNSHQE
jgi:two-component SAPR family response regulator